MGNDSTSTSFLDILACALGGTALLFLILVTLPHHGDKAETRVITTQISPIQAPQADTGKPQEEVRPRLFLVSHPECQLNTNNEKIVSISHEDNVNVGMRHRVLIQRMKGCKRKNRAFGIFRWPVR